MEFDVVVAGGGPNGLMLGAELALHGARPLVLEKRTGPNPEQRSNGVVGQVVRMLDRRGLYARLAGNDEPPRPAPTFMFGAFALPLHRLPENPVYGLLVPQQRIEEVLAERARELGVEVRTGVDVTGFRDEEDHVVVETDGGPITARWLVGADGGRSRIRKLAGIGFPGVTNADSTARAAHVTIPEELIDPVSGGLDVPGYGKIPPFQHHRTERGLITVARFPDGRTLLSVIDREPTPAGLDFSALAGDPEAALAGDPEAALAGDSAAGFAGDSGARGSTAPDGPMTLDELRAAAHRVLGVPLEIGPPTGDGPHLMRRTTDRNTRLADRYRSGHVLLVGDAAHVHSAIGGPGLNLGLQDAVNLGWKLAAEVGGRAPEGLVDTYESERRPVAERVTMHTQAQSVLTGPGPDITALRTLFGEMLTDLPTLARVADLLAGAGFAYAGAGPWAPDLNLADGTRLATLTRPGGFLLIDRDGIGPVDGVRHVEDSGPGPSMLLRPDCYLAWTSNEPAADLGAAVARWISGPGTPAA